MRQTILLLHNRELDHTIIDKNLQLRPAALIFLRCLCKFLIITEE